MESSSRIYASPSFTATHSSNDIADRVVHELRTQNDDVFTFSDVEEEEEEGEFEFPVSTGDGQISLRYPLFDRSLLPVDSPVTESKPPRPSLRQLLTADRDDTPSTSSQEDLTGVAPGTYCVWKPNTNTKKELPRGKQKKSCSVSVDNISKRWKVRDLLKRSYSDESYNTGKESPVVVFLPPISPNKGVKLEKNIPAYKAKKKIGNIRIPPHYQYRQGLVAGFANKSLPLLNV